MSSECRSSRLALLVAVVCLTEQTLAESGRRAVDFEGEAGFRLAASYYPGKENTPGVLILHQCDRKGEATGFEMLAGLLAERGFHVLLPDLRGYGRSRNEEFTGANWQAAQKHHEGDVEAAYQYLVSREGVSGGRVGVVGASCGGRQAIHLATSHAEVRAIVLLSSRLGGAMLESARAMPDRAVLAIAAKGDGSAAQSSEAVVERSSHPRSTVMLFEGAAHGTPLFDEEAALPEAIVDWIASCLTQESPPGAGARSFRR